MLLIIKGTVDNDAEICYDTSACSEGRSFAGNDEPDKATGWNVCFLSGFLFWANGKPMRKTEKKNCVILVRSKR